MLTRLLNDMFSFMMNGIGNKANSKSSAAEVAEVTQLSISSGSMEPRTAPGTDDSHFATVGEHLVNHMRDEAMMLPWLRMANIQREYRIHFRGGIRRPRSTMRANLGIEKFHMLIEWRSGSDI